MLLHRGNDLSAVFHLCGAGGAGAAQYCLGDQTRYQLTVLHTHYCLHPLYVCEPCILVFVVYLPASQEDKVCLEWCSASSASHYWTGENDRTTCAFLLHQEDRENKDHGKFYCCPGCSSQNHQLQCAVPAIPGGILSQTGDLSLEDVMSFELSPYPPSLCEDKILRKANKPQLAQGIHDHCTKAVSCE